LDTHMPQSNLQIKANLMIDDGRNQEPHFPGDFAYQLNPSSFDSRVQRTHWTDRQIHEYQQTLICLRCKRPCAGTCLVHE